MKDEVRATTEQGKRMLHRVYDYNVEYMTTNWYAPNIRI